MDLYFTNTKQLQAIPSEVTVLARNVFPVIGTAPLVSKYGTSEYYELITTAPVDFVPKAGEPSGGFKLQTVDIVNNTDVFTEYVVVITKLKSPKRLLTQQPLAGRRSV